MKDVSLPKMTMKRKREYRSDNSHGSKLFIGSQPVTRFFINDSNIRNLFKNLPEFLSTEINPQISIHNLTNDGGFIA
jgi:hypothetical protein